MKRSWLVWIGFLLCVLVTAAAMTWVTCAVVRLDRAQAEARRQAALEENVRLALWRADAALAPLITQESLAPGSPIARSCRTGNRRHFSPPRRRTCWSIFSSSPTDGSLRPKLRRRQPQAGCRRHAFRRADPRGRSGSSPAWQP